MLKGSTFSTSIQARADYIRLLAGAPRRYVKTADSGAQRVHALCGDCGSLYMRALRSCDLLTLRRATQILHGARLGRSGCIPGGAHIVRAMLRASSPHSVSTVDLQLAVESICNGMNPMESLTPYRAETVLGRCYVNEGANPTLFSTFDLVEVD